MNKKLLPFLFVFILCLPEVWAQAPPPPPPPPPGTGAPIDTDLLYLLIPAALFAVYRLNKKRIVTFINS